MRFYYSRFPAGPAVRSTDVAYSILGLLSSKGSEHTKYSEKDTHEITPSGLSARICSCLFRVDGFLNLISLESKVEVLGP